jgi:hypothetical protein
VAEARVAKKAAGAIFGQLDLLELRDAIDMVVDGLYDLQTLSSAMRYILQEETQMGIEVFCIGLAGVTIDLGNGMYFGNRMAHYSVVRYWLASTAKQSCGRTYSRVILSHDFNMPLAINSSYGGVNDIVRL